MSWTIKVPLALSYERKVYNNEGNIVASNITISEFVVRVSDLVVDVFHGQTYLLRSTHKKPMYNCGMIELSQPVTVLKDENIDLVLRVFEAFSNLSYKRGMMIASDYIHGRIPIGILHLALKSGRWKNVFETHNPNMNRNIILLHEESGSPDRHRKCF